MLHIMSLTPLAEPLSQDWISYPLLSMSQVTSPYRHCRIRCCAWNIEVPLTFWCEGEEPEMWCVGSTVMDPYWSEALTVCIGSHLITLNFQVCHVNHCTVFLFSWNCDGLCEIRCQREINMSTILYIFYRLSFLCSTSVQNVLCDFKIAAYSILCLCWEDVCLLPVAWWCVL